MMKAINMGGRAMFMAWLKRRERFPLAAEVTSFWMSRISKKNTPATARELVMAVAVTVETVDVVTTVEIIIKSFNRDNFSIILHDL